MASSVVTAVVRATNTFLGAAHEMVLTKDIVKETYEAVA
jgi:hypothetical protein